MKDWQFTGTFCDFEAPRKFNQLKAWIISGAYDNLDEKRYVYSYRARNQLIYQSKADGKLQKHKRTPLSLGLSLISYHSNRSKSDIETLNSTDQATPYDDCTTAKLIPTQK